MVAYHFIAIMSSYNQGGRVGWHYTSTEKLDKDVINAFFSKVQRKCGEVQFGIHKLSTESTKWASVVEKDKFFEDVAITPDMDTFIKFVSDDQELDATDIAKFLLTIRPSSHLKLQKLLYYCYAEFLEKTGQSLFRDKILAYKYGPVVQSVFKKFKIHGSSIIDYREDETFIISTEEIAATPSFLKIANSEYGLVALQSILKVIQEYGSMDPFDLVERTHRVGGPWERVYHAGLNKEITDDLIIQYHEFAR